MKKILTLGLLSLALMALLSACGSGEKTATTPGSTAGEDLAEPAAIKERGSGEDQSETKGPTSPPTIGQPPFPPPDTAPKK